MNPVRITLLILGLVALLTGATPAAAQSDRLHFESPQTTIEFPDWIRFEVTAASEGSDIVAATLIFHVRSAYSLESRTRVPLTVMPGKRVALSYTWLTAGSTVVPSSTIVYHWEVRDLAGNVTQSPEMTLRYNDTRFEWRILENESIAVWWHDRPEAFGERVFEIASAAVAEQRDLFGVSLDFQITILIYNNFAEFAGWHGRVSEFVGGQAFPDQGITAQIVSAYGSQEVWLNDVVPHEISHLYFAQAATNPTAPTPVWLDEGVAQYNERTDNRLELRALELAAARGELIVLSTLSQGFGEFDEGRVRLAYREALSAVTYLVETYGESALSNLLAAYKAGRPTDAAFQAALGVSINSFERDWAASLGVSETDYQIPTPWPLPTFRPSPTPFVLSTATAVPQPSAPAPAATLVAAQPVTAAAAAVTEETPPATPAPVAAANRPPLPTILLVGLVGGVGFLSFAGWLARRRRA